MNSLYESPDRFQSEYNINVNKSKSFLAINGQWSHIIEAINALTDENQPYKFTIKRIDDSECLIHVRETERNYAKKIPERLARLYLRTEDFENSIEDLTIEDGHTIYMKYAKSNSKIKPTLKFGPFETVNIQKDGEAIIEELKLPRRTSTPLRHRLGVPRLNALFQNGAIICPNCGETSLYVNDINVENIEQYGIDCASECGFTYEKADVSWVTAEDDLRDRLNS